MGFLRSLFGKKQPNPVATPAAEQPAQGQTSQPSVVAEPAENSNYVPEKIRQYIAALKDNDWSVRKAAAEALAEIGAPAVKPLIAVLKDRDWSVREAAEALGEIGDERAVEPLIAALKDIERKDWRKADNDWLVRKAAAEALDKLNWKPGQDEAGAYYWKTKWDWDKCVEIGAPAVQPLIAALKDRNTRDAASDALAKIGAPIVEPLIAALKDNDLGVRKGAANALGKIGDARAVEPLIAALMEGGTDDSAGVLRSATARALGNIGAPAVEALIAAFNASKSQVREAVTIALVLTGDARAMEPFIAVVKDSKWDGGDRYAAARALDELNWKPGQDETALRYWMAKSEWSKCAEIGAPAVEPLIAALKDSYFGVRRGAASALGKIGDARAVEPLVAILKDSDWGVGKAAAIALDKLNWKPGQDETGAYYWVTKGKWDNCVEIGLAGIQPLIAALKDLDTHKAATDALVKIGASAVEPLIAALDRDWGLRAWAAEALGKIGDARAVDCLTALLSNSDSGVRQNSAKALELIKKSQGRSQENAQKIRLTPKYICPHCGSELQGDVLMNVELGMEEYVVDFQVNCSSCGKVISKKDILNH